MYIHIIQISNEYLNVDNQIKVPKIKISSRYVDDGERGECSIISSIPGRNAELFVRCCKRWICERFSFPIFENVFLYAYSYYYSLLTLYQAFIINIIAYCINSMFMTRIHNGQCFNSKDHSGAFRHRYIRLIHEPQHQLSL